MKWIRASNNYVPLYSEDRKFTIETTNLPDKPFVLRKFKILSNTPHLITYEPVGYFRTVNEAKESAKKYI